MVLGALLLVPTAGVAVAQSDNTIFCNEPGTCEGTNNSDTIVADNDTQKVIAKDGNDDVELDVGFAVPEAGGNKVDGSDDEGLGGEGRDCIDGGGGDDLIIGGEGDDNRPCEFTAFVNPRAALTAGPGDDKVEGGPGDDSMDGIGDDDKLSGNRGDDLIEDFMTNDEDRLFGNRGDDTLNATDADDGDKVDGGPGRDDCSGDASDTFRNCERVSGGGTNSGFDDDNDGGNGRRDDDDASPTAPLVLREAVASVECAAYTNNFGFANPVGLRACVLAAVGVMTQGATPEAACPQQGMSSRRRRGQRLSDLRACALAAASSRAKAPLFGL